jgi:hypothetical protein
MTFEAHGLEIRVERDPVDGYLNVIIYTENLEPKYEHGDDSRIPKLRILVNEEEDGIRINSNGNWVGEHIASPLEQLAEEAE